MAPLQARQGRAVGRVTETSFAHASEAELARILEYYGITWEYEAHAFPIRWTLDGRVAESFSPDFYLPELDLYVELTTLKQSLVRKKNRKLRRLRELYPDVRIKLFYARDFRALMLKYGRFGLLDSLSGTEGQASGRAEGPPARPVAPVVAPASEPTGEPLPEHRAPPAAATGRRRRRAAPASTTT